MLKASHQRLSMIRKVGSCSDAILCCSLAAALHGIWHDMMACMAVSLSLLSSSVRVT
jgi:hypothetical protein